MPPYGERSPPHSGEQRLPQAIRQPRAPGCCSPECERSYREKLDIKSTMAEVGMEPAREKRKCEHRGGDIPLWRKGKTVAKNVRFCGESCQRKARRQKTASSLQKRA